MVASVSPFASKRRPRRQSRSSWGPVQTLLTVGGVAIGALIGLRLTGDVPLPALPVADVLLPVFETPKDSGPSEPGLDHRLSEERADTATGDAAALDADDAIGSIDEATNDSFACPGAQVVDGDTLRCGAERVRLHGIDAPELPGHCRPGRDCVEGDPFASSDHLRDLAGGSALVCTRVDTDSYGRTVARCTADGVDLSCAQIEAGHAVRRYGFIRCG